MNRKKYPLSLFVTGFFMNLVLRFFWLFIPAVVLCIVGIFITPCLFIGLFLLLFDLILSLTEQVKLRKVTLEASDNPEFTAFQDALTQTDEDWTKEVKKLVEEKVNEGSSEENNP